MIRASFGLVSLENLREFLGSNLCALTGLLSQLTVIAERTPSLSLSDENIGIFKEIVLGDGRKLCDAMELCFSCKYMDFIAREIDRHGTSLGDLSTWASVLEGRIKDELSAEVLFQIPRQLQRFLMYTPGEESAVEANFGVCLPEMSAAGRCLAYGEPTAAVFHLMRVVDKCIRLVADSINATYENSNWGGVAKAVREYMYDPRNKASSDWPKKEKFYASILADIQGIGKAHRNPTLHELEAKYTEKEAEQLFAIVEGFMEHLAENGVRAKDGI